MAEEKKTGWQLIEQLNEYAYLSDGDPVVAPGKGQTSPLKWKNVLYLALAADYKDEAADPEKGKEGISYEKKKSLSLLAQKIIRAKPGMNLTVEELADIGRYVSKFWSRHILGPVMEMIEGVYEAPEIEDEVNSNHQEIA
jgi:hypothetical protein